MTLEQQLADIRERNGLSGLSIHIDPRGRFYAYAHRGSGCGCTDEHKETIAEAITGAINDLTDIGTLAPMGEAA